MFLGSPNPKGGSVSSKQVCNGLMALFSHNGVKVKNLHTTRSCQKSSIAVPGSRGFEARQIKRFPSNSGVGVKSSLDTEVLLDLDSCNK